MALCVFKHHVVFDTRESGPRHFSDALLSCRHQRIKEVDPFLLQVPSGCSKERATIGQFLGKMRCFSDIQNGKLRPNTFLPRPKESLSAAEHKAIDFYKRRRQRDLAQLDWYRGIQFGSPGKRGFGLGANLTPEKKGQAMVKEALVFRVDDEILSKGNDHIRREDEDTKEVMTSMASSSCQGDGMNTKLGETTRSGGEDGGALSPINFDMSQYDLRSRESRSVMTPPGGFQEKRSTIIRRSEDAAAAACRQFEQTKALMMGMLDGDDSSSEEERFGGFSPRKQDVFPISMSMPPRCRNLPFRRLERTDENLQRNNEMASTLNNKVYVPHPRATPPPQNVWTFDVQDASSNAGKEFRGRCPPQPPRKNFRIFSHSNVDSNAAKASRRPPNLPLQRTLGAFGAGEIAQAYGPRSGRARPPPLGETCQDLGHIYFAIQCRCHFVANVHECAQDVEKGVVCTQ